MSVRMRTWLAKAKGLGNGDNNPLLDEDEKKQQINNNNINDDENPWGTIAINNDEIKYDNNNNNNNNNNANDINDIQQSQSQANSNNKKKSKQLKKQQNNNDNYQQLESNNFDSINYHNTSFTSPNTNNMNSINSNRPYLVPPARDSALVALKAFPSPFRNPKAQDKTKFYIHLNEDLFLYCLSFLNNSDLTQISVVCKKWKLCSYEPILWRRLNLSKYSYGSHDYLLKHILINDPCNRFNHVLQINLENCSALTDQSLIFITRKCPYLRILYLTNCYRLSPKTIYFTVQKLQYLHKLELYGVISTHNKYYHIQQLQQLTFFLNELGIQSGHIASQNIQQPIDENNNQDNQNNNNNNNDELNLNDNNNEANEEAQQQVDDPAMRNAQNVANDGDDANPAANPAAAANNVQNEANMIDNQPSLNNRIQRVRLMICLAKAIKNCRPWMDLGLFWMQILSMVGRNDPLMILSRNKYDQLYATQNEMSNNLYLNNSGKDLNYLYKKEEFNGGARYMTINEYKLYIIRKEMQMEAQLQLQQQQQINADHNNNNNIEHSQSESESMDDDEDDDDDMKMQQQTDGTVYVGITNTTNTFKKKKKKKKTSGIDLDLDFELAPDHEWMQSKSSLEMDTFNNNNMEQEEKKGDHGMDNNNDMDDGFYPKHYPTNTNMNMNMMDDNEIDNPLFAFNKLRVEKLRSYFVTEFDLTLPPNLCVAECRYFGRFQGGCWGRVIGRIVYSNMSYSQHGNYPCEVLFSCEAHSNEDFTDALLDKCQSCERLFRAESMLNTNNLICKTCYDSKKLQEKCIWVNLNKTGLKNFNFNHIIQYTLNVADKRNLPVTLKSYGKIKAQLTYNIADAAAHNNENENVNENENENENEEEKQINENDNDNDNEQEEKKEEIDYSRISVSTFWENNQLRINSMMDKFNDTLKIASSRKATRAILVYCDAPNKKKPNQNQNRAENKENENDNENKDNANEADDDDDDIEQVDDEEENELRDGYIEILADPGVLFDGLDGVDYIFLTVSAWTQFYSIFSPILFSILCTLYFLSELSVYNYNALNNDRYAASDSSNGISLPDAPSNNNSSSMYLFYALGAFLILITGAFIAYRFQRKCEQVFRLFLVLDIFLILSIGFAILFIIMCVNYNVSCDVITFWLLTYNFGLIGVLTFYLSVSPGAHRLFLVILNCIMSIMITSAINWYVIFLLLILICADIIAMFKPSFGRMFSPFLVPTQIQLPNTTPRIFYQVYGLRVRAPEFMFYGLMLGLITPANNQVINYTQVILLLITVVSGFVISVFIMPFFSKQIRPLPVSFIFLIISIIFYKQIFKSYQDNNVWTLLVP